MKKISLLLAPLMLTPFLVGCGNGGGGGGGGGRYRIQGNVL